MRGRVGALLDDKVPGIGKEAADLLGGKKTPAQLLEEAKKKAEQGGVKKLGDELKKRLPGGLFPPKKRDKK